MICLIFWFFFRDKYKDPAGIFNFLLWEKKEEEKKHYNEGFLRMDILYSARSLCDHHNVKRHSGPNLWHEEREREGERKRRKWGILIMQLYSVFTRRTCIHAFVRSHYFSRSMTRRLQPLHVPPRHHLQLIRTIHGLEILWNSMNGSYCHRNNKDPWRRVYLTEQIPSVSRLSYSPQRPMQMPRHNQMQQHDAFITLSIIFIRQHWNKASPRPVIELKGKRLSAEGNFNWTCKPYVG